MDIVPLIEHIHVPVPVDRHRRKRPLEYWYLTHPHLPFFVFSLVRLRVVPLGMEGFDPSLSVVVLPL